jgi:hypothetical protein
MVSQSEDDAIRLVVKSADDVTMLSAFLQDGLVAHHDIHFDKARAEVVMVVDRYRWEADAERKERVLMGLRIGKVSALLQKQMTPEQMRPEQMRPGAGDGASVFYNLLQLAYEKSSEEAGALLFTFSGGAVLRLVVDDLMMSAGDIAPPRPAIATPLHDD